MGNIKKRLGGFKNIYVAPVTAEGTYGVPVPVEGAKEIEAELAYESIQFYADNSIDFNDYLFTGGEGTLTVSGLTMGEYNTLFGSTVNKGGVLVKSTDVAPELAIMFERDKLGVQNGKVMYVIYATKFAPPSIGAQTKEDAIEEELVEMSFTVRELADGEIFYMLDTTETGYDAAAAAAWYTKVQKPGAVAGVSINATK